MTAATNIDELRDLYRELILDHARHPRHFGRLEDATHTAEGINPLCGDKLKLYLRLDEDSAIADIMFEGTGCAISVASASLLTDAVRGISAARARAFADAVTDGLTNDQGSIDTGDKRLEKLQALQGVREFPARVKCATLAWRALGSAIQEESMPVSTE